MFDPTMQPRMEVVATLDRATADMAAGILIERSIPFAVDPRPGDLSAILVGADAARDVKRLLIGSEPAPSWQPRLVV